MKRQLLFILLSVSALCLKGQAYHPMLSDSSVWYISYRPEGVYTDKYYTSGDTVISGKHYYKYFRRMSQKDILCAFLREDTESKKVYFKGNKKFFKKDTADVLLYDFNLKLGDSILWINPTLSSNYSNEDSLGLHDYYEFRLDTIGWSKIDEVFTIETKIGERLVFLVVGKVYSATWIESFGFGSDNYENPGRLNCFFRRGIKEYEDLFYSQYYECDISEPGSVQTIESDNFKIINENDQLRLIINDFLGGAADLRIFDSYGRMVKQCRITSSETTINISNLTKGVYIVSLEYRDKRLSQKIVK